MKIAGFMRANDVMIGNKHALDCGYGNAGKPAHPPCAASAPAY
jgi:S-adenosylhomocysteine hydrolase